MNKKQKKILLIIIVSAGLFLVRFIFFDAVPVEAYKLTVQDAVKGITVTGRVKSEEDVKIASVVTAVIDQYYAEEGDFIEKDQIIAELKREEQEGAFESAEANLQVAEWELKDLLTEPRNQEIEIAKAQVTHAGHRINILEHTLARIEIDLEDANINEERYKALEAAGAVSKRESEQKTLKKRELENTIGEVEGRIHQTFAELDEAKENLNLVIHKVKSEKILAAKGRAASAAGRVKIAKGKLDDYIIKAPVSGILVDIFLYEGDVTSPLVPMARFVNPDLIYLSLDVEETEKAAVKTGQKAFVIFDAYPDKVFKSCVKGIIKQVDPLTGTFETKLNRPDKKIPLVVGMTLDATIISGEYKNALIIPTDFIVNRDGKNYVFRKFGFLAKKTLIEIERFDNNRTKIIKGLKENDIILKTSDDTKNKLKNNNHIKITGYRKK